MRGWLLALAAAWVLGGVGGAGPLRMPLSQAWDLETPEGWAVARPARRTQRWTRTQALELREEPAGMLRWRFLGAGDEVLGEAAPLPARWVLPRLDYAVGRRPDDFDAFNLMLAEFARMGVQVPLAGDASEATRVLVANNCLEAGLWEVSVQNSDGRVLHGWFDFPRAAYLELVARLGGLPQDFVAGALSWRTAGVRPRLERLRRVVQELGESPLTLDPAFAFESVDQEQTLKQTKSKFRAGRVGHGASYPVLADLEVPVRFADFIPPGRYTPRTRRSFDLSFLLHPGRARLRRVAPRVEVPGGRAMAPGEYLELELELGELRLVLGNLPLDRLRAGEDMRIHGFGVGVPGPRMRARDHRSDEELGRPPCFAYLLEGRGRGARAVNTHARGLETLDLHLAAGATPRLEVIVGSFERMTSLVRYRVALPPSLVP